MWRYWKRKLRRSSRTRAGSNTARDQELEALGRRADKKLAGQMEEQLMDQQTYLGMQDMLDLALGNPILMCSRFG